MTQQLLTTEQAAAVLSMPPATLAEWRRKGVGPAWMRLGKHVRYRPSDLDSWVSAQVEKSKVVA